MLPASSQHTALVTVVGHSFKTLFFGLRLVWSLFAPLLFFHPFSLPVLSKEGADGGDADEPGKARIG